MRYSHEEIRQRASDRAKKAILSIVSASGGTLRGKLRLYKAFYKAHLNYFELTGLNLTGYPIVHMNEGPGIDKSHVLIGQLGAEGLLKEERLSEHRPNECTYTLVKPLDQGEWLTKEKELSIKQAVEWANSLTEQELKVQSHNRSWQQTQSGKEQNIYIDLLSEEEYRGRRSEVIEAYETYIREA